MLLSHVRWLAQACLRSLRRSVRPLALPLLALCASLPDSLSAADAGVIAGTISNAATGNLLEGAKVTIKVLGIGGFADNTGRYVLTGVPAGTHELEVSYIGLDTVQAQVAVSAGGRAERNFDLTTGIYKLEAFKVTGEREGDAAALTLQRNAENVKNVVSMDSFGNLPNMSAGEVVARLPGVAGSPHGRGPELQVQHARDESRPEHGDGRRRPPAQPRHQPQFRAAKHHGHDV